MFRKSFSRYAAVIGAAAVIFFLGIFAFSLSRSFAACSDAQIRRMEESASGCAQSIGSYISLAEADFATLAQDYPDVVRGTMDTESASSGAVIFITDIKGKVFFSTDDTAASEGSSIPESEISGAIRASSAGEYFSGDLGGYFSEKRICRVVPMQKEYKFSSSDKTRRQTVGLIFISDEVISAKDIFSAVPPEFVAVIGAAAVILISALIIVYRRLISPMEEISRVSESFAHGDFSSRAEVPGTGAVSSLAERFNDMAESIKETNETRDAFVANISHDLRTPMTTVGGYVQNMREGIIPQDRFPHYLEIIHTETARMSRLVGSLLEMSKLSKGEKKFTFSVFDLCELAKQNLLSFEKRITDKNIEVSFLSEKDRSPVKADKDAVWQVIYNLIDNAVKFTPEGGTLSIALKQSADKAFFEVENSGEGIPPEELPHIFDRFYKSDRSRGLDKTGTGLGLYIAKAVINAHGEDIWVTSEYGKYCRFVFSLPTAKVETRK